MIRPAGNGTVRPAALDDVAELTALVAENREFLSPWDPIRPDEFFTIGGQSRALQVLLERRERGQAAPYVILGVDGSIVGRITLDGIVRGALQSATLGYWVGRAHNGRGHGTAAIGAVVRIAFDELGLHRLEAGTLPDNIRSQHVLERNGFTRYGLAPSLMRIAGRWQDHVMFQTLNEHWTGTTAEPKPDWPVASRPGS
jgi:[ribosomal protein S5]-alanine N-acetyltransferase